ncbi:hypothetical protein D6D03_01128 [Aureobasidium pullulans]|nr:hypothetical protein D6D03_01128 [Aureobasidium pullulans]
MSKETASTGLRTSAISRQPELSLSPSIDSIRPQDFADAQQHHNMNRLASTEEANNAPNPPSVDQNHSISDLVSVQMLRIEIFGPVSSGQLTPTELNGGVDGPTISPLIQAWREAFRSLPDLHQIRHVQFDMSCRDKHEPRHIIRFLQEISTAMYIKAKRNLGREMVFEVIGCEQEKKTWLEASLPGQRAV